jgi:hypothetical protein
MELAETLAVVGTNRPYMCGPSTIQREVTLELCGLVGDGVRRVDGGFAGAVGTHI